MGNVFSDHGEEDDLLVQHLVVGQVVDEGRGCVIGGAVHKDGSAGHAGRRLRRQVGEQHLQRHRLLQHALGEDFASPLPGRHQQEDHRRNEQGDPAAVADLQHVRAEEQQVHPQEQAGHDRGAGEAPAPHFTAHHVEHQRRNEHQRRQGHAVRAGDVARGAEREHQGAGERHEAPVDSGHVDLADLAGRRVLDSQPRAVAELHRLARQGERTGDHRLRRDDRGGRRERDQRVQRPARCEVIERVHRGGGVAQQQGPLPEVIEQQAREGDPEPRHLNRPVAEVAEVRVQGLTARDHEEDGAQHHEAAVYILGEEA